MNTNVLAFFAALRSVLIAFGAILVALNFGDTHTYKIVMQASGAVMVVGPLFWALYEKIVTLKKTFAAAVQAGISLTLSGRAVDAKGNAISSLSPDAIPLRQVTVESATEIIKEFAPSPSSIAKN